MDPTEVRDIIDMATKLEATFRHIRFLCMKYEEMQSGVTSYHPFSQFSFHPGPFIPPSNYPLQNYYPPSYGYNYPFDLQNKKNYPSNTSNQNNQSTQNTKSEKNPQQKKPQPIQNGNSNAKEIKPSNNSSDSKVYPASAYHIFLSKKKSQIKKEYPQLGEKELLQIMSEVWKSFDDNQRQPYELEWKRLKYLANQKSKDQKNGIKSKTSEIALSLKDQLMKQSTNQKQKVKIK